MRKRVFFFIVMLVTILVLVFSCKTTDKPEQKVAQFVGYFNSANVEGMINCLEPELSSKINLGIEFLDGLVDFDVKSIVKLLPFFAPIADNIEYEGVTVGDIRPQLQVEILEVKTNESKSKIMTAITVLNNKQSFNVNFHLILKNRVWYIENLSES